MENNNYLIPANSKKSQFMFGLFTKFEFWGILVPGIAFSVLLFLTVKSQSLFVMLGLASPALIAIFLVLPIPNYHNIMTFVRNLWKFYSNRRKYYWKGWCACYDDRKSENSDNVYFK